MLLHPAVGTSARGTHRLGRDSGDAGLKTPVTACPSPVPAERADGAASNRGRGTGRVLQGCCPQCSQEQLRCDAPRRGCRFGSGTSISPGSAKGAEVPCTDQVERGPRVPQLVHRGEGVEHCARRVRAKCGQQHQGCGSHSRVCVSFRTDLWAGATLSFQGAPAVKEQNHKPERKRGELGRCRA